MAAGEPRPSHPPRHSHSPALTCSQELPRPGTHGACFLAEPRLTRASGVLRPYPSPRHPWALTPGHPSALPALVSLARQVLRKEAQRRQEDLVAVPVLGGFALMSRRGTDIQGARDASETDSKPLTSILMNFQRAQCN